MGKRLGSKGRPGEVVVVMCVVVFLLQLFIFTSCWSIELTNLCWFQRLRLWERKDGLHDCEGVLQSKQVFAKRKILGGKRFGSNTRDSSVGRLDWVKKLCEEVVERVLSEEEGRYW